MTKLMTRAALASLLIMAVTLPVQGGVIERACMASGRDSANPGLCGCIQDVADATLRGREQRKVAKFFRNPDRAQDVRQSSRSSDRQLWGRYTAFGAAAESSCS